MIKKYSEFILENLNKSKSILKSKLDDYEKIKKFLTDQNAMGYMGKFTELLFSNVPYTELITLYNNIIDLKRKSIRINIDDFDKYEKILDEISKLQTDYKFKNIFNQFPKEQKDIFSDITNLRQDWKQSISKLYDVDYKPFITKISRYKDEDDLMDAIERFLNSKLKSFEKDDIKALLSDELKLVFENKNILIVRTYTHESISLIGSDTSWCIVSSQYTFKSYTSNGCSQFVLFDYTKDRFESDFKIGFTLTNQNTIAYAHDIFDKSIIPYTKELLNKNEVDIDAINIVPKPDISELSTKTSASYLLDFVRSYNIAKYDDIFRKLLSIISSKLSETPATTKVHGRRRRSNDNHYIMESLINMFRKLKRHIGRPIEIEEFDSYKTEMNENYDKIKKYISDSSDLILISDIIPKNIFSDPEILLKNYKKWDYEIQVGNAQKYISDIEDNPQIAEAILYYCNKGRVNNTKKLVASYCNMIMGEKVNMTYVKDIISRSFPINKYYFFNIFGIKYPFNSNNITQMKMENIIGEVNLENINPSRLVQLAAVIGDSNKSISIVYSQDHFTNLVNSSYKWLGKQAVKKNYTPTVDTILIDPIKDKIISKNRRLQFSDETKFPIKYEIRVANNKHNPSGNNLENSNLKVIKITIE